ncbi:hypothetical protein [Allomuricauda sp. F6463D]|uniref:hypothetical protein n=1 Tax=Allomuricauda sp. F6463D TaxID=2926409 RepID=UPI001FF4A8DF|nr:hypothetical protein [Muricauda sp. F6463D]MCK0160524.1 hypothetical protein [Muricauda sp. F6463D]
MKKTIFFLAAFAFSIGIANAKEVKQGSETLEMELFGLTCHDVALDYAYRILDETGSIGEAGIAYSYAKELCDYYN